MSIAGHITDKWIQVNGSELDLPAQITYGGCELHVTARNDSDVSIIAAVEIRVQRPDGFIEYYPIDWTGMSPGEVLDWAVNIAAFTEGTWLAALTFKTAEINFDHWVGDILIVGTEVAEWVELASRSLDILPAEVEEWVELANRNLRIEPSVPEGEWIELVQENIAISWLPAVGFELIQETIYPFAWVYDGEVEVVTATFTTDPLTPANWIADLFANKLDEEVRNSGGRPLEVRVFVDTTPLLWKEFKIEVVSTPITGISATPRISASITVIPLWATILIVCIGVTAVLIAATLLVKIIKQSFEHHPALHDMKQGWAKETLILTVQDSQDHFDMPVTPTETLQSMSESEVRHLLDQIAEANLPSNGVPWLPLVAGVAAIGAGVAILRKKK